MLNSETTVNNFFYQGLKFPFFAHFFDLVIEFLKQTIRPLGGEIFSKN